MSKVAILDAGAQYGKVIDRRVRELNLESEILPLNIPSEKLKSYDAIIISGGPQSVYDQAAPKFNPEIFSLNKPVLGICYGMQLLNYVSGGRVGMSSRREDGPCVIQINPESKLFSGLTKKQAVLMSHGDSVLDLASGFNVIATSDGIIAAIEKPSKNLYGLQFHPEVDLTINGKEILKNFLFNISKLKPDFSIKNREEIAIREIKETVGDKPVLLFVSGGVDSSVCAALINKALPKKQIFAVHINHGLMRKNESKKVQTALRKIKINLKVLDVSQQFLDALKGIADPEKKRHIIGDQFIRVRDKVMKDLGLDLEKAFLVQGTLRPDLIESASSLASKSASTIKTHHNDSPLVRKLREKGRIIEPLKDYHKDEVRKLGRLLGLPSSLVNRQPFPGPGLAVRIICAVKPSNLSKAKISSSAYLQGLAKLSRHGQTYHDRGTFVHVLPIRTVGVQGDGRTYKCLATLSGEKNWKKLFELAREIPKHIHEVNRVVYVFGDPIDQPITEITPTFITKETISQLQEADEVVNKILEKQKLMGKIAQMPVILTPLNFGIAGHRSIALRPFITNDFMTGMPAIPGIDIPEKAVNEMVSKILKITGISRVMLDLTSKPPGTTEWE